MRNLIDRPLNLTLVCPNPKDGTSFWRGHGPFGLLARQEPNLRLHTGSDFAQGQAAWSWCDMARADVCVLQRPAGPPHLQVAQMAKEAGIPLWLDMDDDVTEVPISNRYFHSFPQPQTSRCVEELAAMADVITVTTDALAAKFGAKARVIPNALPDHAVGFSDGPRSRVVTWRGSNTHDGDVESVLPQLAEAALDTAWRWWFYGDPGWRLAKAMPSNRVKIGPVWSSFPTMVADLAAVAPYIHVVPLEHCKFNAAKSNAAWIEATAFGAAVLAPDMPEWRRPGITNYRDAKDFGRQLKRLMADYDNGKFHPNVAASREHIREHLLLTNVNALRALVATELADKKPLRSLVQGGMA